MAANESSIDAGLGSLPRVNFQAGQGGLPMMRVETPWSAGEIYLHGAHVTHFQKCAEPPLLWLSAESRFEANTAIRGGVPIILPWFGPREGKPAHGFARVKNWELQEIGFMSSRAVKIRLRLPQCPEAAEFAPFTAEYTVTVSDRLKLELAVTNTSADRELAFEDCLHTYFTIGDIGSIKVLGLKGLTYLDKVGGTTERLETNEAIQISSEVDRVYQDTTGPVGIHDARLGRLIRVEKTGSASTVVWNPWIAKSKAMADFGDEEYHGMVCVESGNVGKNKLVMGPGKTATMSVTLSSGV